MNSYGLIIEFSPNRRLVKFGRKKKDLSLTLCDRCKKLIKNKVTSEIGQTTVLKKKFLYLFGKVVSGEFERVE